MEVSKLLNFLLIFSLSTVTQASYPSELTETTPLNPPEHLLPTRLPEVNYPTQYWIKLQPYFPSSVTYPKDREFTFDGSEVIEFNVLKSATNVTVNARNLTIDATKTTVYCNGENLPVAEVRTLPKEKDQVAVMLKEGYSTPAGGKCNVTFVWIGPLNDFKIASFFKSSYVNNDGETKWIVASHFEEGGMCRSAIPSFDEPMYKSIYHFALVHPKDLKALSNGMENPSIDAGEGWAITTFKPVKLMSTYLMAFAIGDFTGIQRVNKHGVLVRAWSWRGMEPYLDTALDVGVRAIDWFSDYFDYPLPLEKQDLLALPTFRPGAMENWGLVIFRHQQMCYNPHMHTSYTRAQSIISTVVHELSHQWFGDLVTTKWWSDLFLNEGHAQYWQSVGSFGIFPDQADIFDITAAAETLEVALQFDGVPRVSHPIVDMRGPFFDRITYNKGGSLLRMINHTIGEPLYRKALQNYIKKYAFNNTLHRMMLDCFTEVADEAGILDWCGNPLNMTKMMDPWYHQQGFPTIVVRHSEDGTKHVRQRPFQNFTELGLPESPLHYQWPIPDFYRNIHDGQYHLNWIMPESETLACDISTTISRRDTSVTVENAATRAYTRVLYDNTTWLPILNHIRENPGAFDVLTRTSLLNDALVFMKTPEIPGYTRFLNLTLYLGQELKLAPWKFAAIPEFKQFVLDFQQGELWPNLLLYFRETIGPVYDALGWVGGENWDTNALRDEITTLACRLHLRDCTAKAQQLFKRQLLGGCAEPNVPYCSKVDPDVRRAVYSAGVELGTLEEFDKVWAIYDAERNRNRQMTNERDNLMNGLCATRHTSGIIRLLDYAVRDAEGMGTLTMTNLGLNPVATVMMWTYFNDNLVKVMDSVVHTEFLKQMTNNWNTKERVVELRAFYNSRSSELSEAQGKAVLKAADDVQAHFDKFSELGHSIADWLTDRYDVPHPSANSTQLPLDHVQPVDYAVNVRPYFPASKVAKYDKAKEFTFDANCTIRVQCHVATNEIYLNADKLTFSKVVVVDEYTHKEVPLTTIGVRNYPSVQQIVIMLQHGLIPQVGHQNFKMTNFQRTYSVHMTYTGVINNYMDDGLYSTVHVTKDGVHRYAVSTQFEHIRARAVFPSFDEPEYKTPFVFTVEHGNDLKAISNTDVETKEDLGHGWQRTTFTVTPKMSSYLTAFIIGDFASKEATNANGVLIRVWDHPEVNDDLGITLDAAIKSTEYFAQYLDQEYPFTKLDLVGISQYKGGGMENFGLITMVSRLVHVDREDQTTAEAARCIEVTTHEVAHQWFGDLITMEWWNEIFLNEGFAGYWEFEAPMFMYPKHANYFSSRYVPEILAAAQRGDGKIDSHAVDYVRGHDPDFGAAITYDKGASLLRMLRFVIGDDVYQQALRSYMKKYAFGNTNHYQLFDEFTNAAQSAGVQDWCGEPMNVTKFLDAWMLQSSFPVITIESQPSRTYLSQKPYHDKNLLRPSAHDYEWPVPVWYKSTNDKEHLSWLVPQSWSTLQIEIIPFSATYNSNPNVKLAELANKCGKSSTLTLTPGALKLTEARTYAVTDYDQASWAQLMTNFFVSHETLHVDVRSQVIHDLQMLAERDPWYNRRLLRLAQYLPSETALAPWDTIKQSFDRWQKVMSDASATMRFKFQSYMLQIHVPIYDQLGWEATTDNWETNILRSQILLKIIDLDYTPALLQAKRRLEVYLKSCDENVDTGLSKCKSRPTPDTEEAIICGGIRQSDKAVWQQLFERFIYEAKTRPAGSRALRLVSGLACTESQEQLQVLVDYVEAETDDQHRQSVLKEIGKHPNVGKQIYKHLQSFEPMPKNDKSARTMKDLIDAMTEHWHSDRHLKQFNALKSRLHFLQHAAVMDDVQRRLEENNKYGKTMHYVMEDYANDRFDAPY